VFIEVLDGWTVGVFDIVKLFNLVLWGDRVSLDAGRRCLVGIAL
jgi:hypothetical protein